MIEHIKVFAERIKGLREISGTSAETLAKQLGISTDLYHKYESGTVDIPVGFLYELAHRHQIELSAILTGENPRLHVYCVTRRGQGLKVERRKQYKYENLAANFILRVPGTASYPTKSKAHSSIIRQFSSVPSQPSPTPIADRLSKQRWWS